jgi:hypothetical protein
MPYDLGMLATHGHWLVSCSGPVERSPRDVVVVCITSECCVSAGTCWSQHAAGQTARGPERQERSTVPAHTGGRCPGPPRPRRRTSQVDRNPASEGVGDRTIVDADVRNTLGHRKCSSGGVYGLGGHSHVDIDRRQRRGHGTWFRYGAVSRSASTLRGVHGTSGRPQTATTTVPWSYSFHNNVSTHESDGARCDSRKKGEPVDVVDVVRSVVIPSRYLGRQVTGAPHDVCTALRVP